MHKLITLFFISSLALSNPYWDPSKIAKDPDYEPKVREWTTLDPQQLRDEGVDILRVNVSYNEGKFKFEGASKERSGTEALLKRAGKKDSLGSYHGVLVNALNDTPLFYDSIGTGAEFRLLTRALTFRFPMTSGVLYRFELYGESPETGKTELILKENVNPVLASRSRIKERVEVKLLKKATVTPALKVNVYAEGYTSTDSTAFFKSAQKTVDTLVSSRFPGVEQFEMVGVYSVSKTKLGKAQDLGMPVPERDSFLGLYFPYWNPFGRWYHVVYPTREKKFRDAVGSVPYDYAIVLVDDSAYWGMGNFNEFTVVPAGNSSFSYLLLHEFGHFFGLNEEYEGGGKTELQFSAKIEEPWSQNITFHPKNGELKWGKFVGESVQLPTPPSVWTGTGPYGAYKGGYADSLPLGVSHKPGFKCTMESGTKFCPICTEAIKEKIRFDTGG